MILGIISYLSISSSLYNPTFSYFDFRPINPPPPFFPHFKALQGVALILQGPIPTVYYPSVALLAFAYLEKASKTYFYQHFFWWSTMPHPIWGIKPMDLFVLFNLIPKLFNNNLYIDLKNGAIFIRVKVHGILKIILPQFNIGIYKCTNTRT